mmetsp:Transcript_13388/g.35138  ORF Transcript_13388/g.35138 Transcript_13388/m.35138 type:complete len:298 (-) Transcript_13388:893-1786(-)
MKGSHSLLFQLSQPSVENCLFLRLAQHVHRARIPHVLLHYAQCLIKVDRNCLNALSKEAFENHLCLLPRYLLSRPFPLLLISHHLTPDRLFALPQNVLLPFTFELSLIFPMANGGAVLAKKSLSLRSAHSIPLIFDLFHLSHHVLFPLLPSCMSFHARFSQKRDDSLLYPRFSFSSPLLNRVSCTIESHQQIGRVQSLRGRQVSNTRTPLISHQKEVIQVCSLLYQVCMAFNYLLECTHLCLQLVLLFYSLCLDQLFHVYVVHTAAVTHWQCCKPPVLNEKRKSLLPRRERPNLLFC